MKGRSRRVRGLGLGREPMKSAKLKDLSPRNTTHRQGIRKLPPLRWPRDFVELSNVGDAGTLVTCRCNAKKRFSACPAE